MPQLHGYPQGLLDLVGAMNRGETPRDMSYVVLPMVDLTTLYLASKQRTVGRSSTVFGAPGFHTGGQLVVPIGETWVLHSWSYGMFTAAGEAASATLMFIQDGTGIAVSPTASIAASASAFINADTAPRVLVSGTRLGIFIHSATGAPTYSGGLLVSILRS